MTGLPTMQFEADRERIPVFHARSEGVAYIYIARRPDTGAVKVGRARNLWARLRAIQTSNDVTIELLAAWRSSPADEALIHGFLAPHRKRGEWYNPTPLILDWIERQSLHCGPAMPTRRRAPDPARGSV